MSRALLPLVMCTAMVGAVGAVGAAEWDRVRVPVKPPNGGEWRLQEDVSDDFSYDQKPMDEAGKIGGKWINHYRGHWSGPGTTLWRHENVAVADGKLWIRATREPGETKSFRFDADQDGAAETLELPATRLGCITSIGTVQSPAYVEARVQIANAVLASNVWMLSKDSTQEIDILEAYGGRGDDGRADWFARRLHVSHHVFIRKPFQDYQPKDDSTWYTRPNVRAKRGESYWTGRYHRMGVYWRDPTHLEWYFNGKLIKTTSGLDNTEEKGGIDPLGYTRNERGERTGLSKPMHLIINMEAQDWNAAAGRAPTEEELRRKRDHTYLVDWIRVYRPETAESE